MGIAVPGRRGADPARRHRRRRCRSARRCARSAAAASHRRDRDAAERHPDGRDDTMRRHGLDGPADRRDDHARGRGRDPGMPARLFRGLVRWRRATDGPGAASGARQACPRPGPRTVRTARRDDAGTRWSRRPGAGSAAAGRSPIARSGSTSPACRAISRASIVHSAVYVEYVLRGPDARRAGGSPRRSGAGPTGHGPRAG